MLQGRADCSVGASVHGSQWSYPALKIAPKDITSVNFCHHPKGLGRTETPETWKQKSS